MNPEGSGDVLNAAVAVGASYSDCSSGRASWDGPVKLYTKDSMTTLPAGIDVEAGHGVWCEDVL